MVKLDEVVAYLDQELNTAGIQDYSGAVNGLQLANGGKIGRIIAAVDASLPVIEAAAAGGPGLLIVHHGMFWQGAQPITGPIYRKLKTAMDAGLAIYSSHLPLDIHPAWGNNVCLAKAIGLENQRPFFGRKGVMLGIRGTWRGKRERLVELLQEVLESNVHCCPGGGAEISEVGIITGGAGSEVAAVHACGIGTFITGEGPHWSYILSEELGMNLLYGGHYATETFGVKAVAKHLSEIFGLPSAFIDRPTHL